MNKNDIDKAYVSPYDKLIFTFDKENELTASQVKEILKHQRIAELRDDANASAKNSELWEDF